MNWDTDLHTHSHFSPCGRSEMKPRDILRVAAERGIKHLANTDHFFPTTDPSGFDSLRREFEEAMAESPEILDLTFGCEAEVPAPGVTMVRDEDVERFDFVMVAATHFRGVPLPKMETLRDLAVYYVRTFEYAVSLPWADVLAHPFLVIPEFASPELLSLITKDDVLPGLETARRNGVAMEISRRIFHTPQQTEFARWFFPLCKEMGLSFTTGSDAHALVDLGRVELVAPVVEWLAPFDMWMPARRRLVGD